MHTISAPLGLLPSHGEHSSRPAEPPQSASLESVAGTPAECAARHRESPFRQGPVSPTAALATIPDSPDSSPVATRQVRRVFLSPESSPDTSPAVPRDQEALGNRSHSGAALDPTSAVAAPATAAAAPLSDDGSQRQSPLACTQPSEVAEAAPSPAAGGSLTERGPALIHSELAPQPEDAAEHRASPAESPEQWRRARPRPGTLDAFLVRPRGTEGAAAPAASGAAEGAGPSQREPTGNDAEDEGDDDDGAAAEPAWLPPAKRRRGLLGCVVCALSPITTNSAPGPRTGMPLTESCLMHVPCATTQSKTESDFEPISAIDERSTIYGIIMCT